MNKTTRPRLRDLGIEIGRYATGPLNAITDVEGVLVGHSTVVIDQEHPVRTGVTAVLPNAGDIFSNRLVGGAFVLNGAGEMSGLIQVIEWGLVETPILLTNTLSVGIASEATVRYMVDRHPGIGTEHDVIIPIVGECDDSWLSDIAGGHIRGEHARAALDGARLGPVEEGSVGGGTGMVAFDLKGGIGTASRVLPPEDGGYTVGVLVMCNFGRLEDLRIDGVPVGEHIAAEMVRHPRRRHSYGSAIAVLATDAPVTSHQINRLCKRVALGFGRVGSYAAHGSGEIVCGFSTANTVPRALGDRTHTLTVLLDRAVDPLYRAAIECTEEAVVNSLCRAESATGREGRIAPALPPEQVVAAWRAAGRRQSASATSPSQDGDESAPRV